MMRLDYEFDAWVDIRQKRLLDKTYKSLEAMLNSSKSQAVLQAIEIVLKVNKRLEPVQRFKMDVGGEVNMQHSGQVDTQMKALKPEEKTNIKQLLDATRHLIESPN